MSFIKVYVRNLYFNYLINLNIFKLIIKLIILSSRKKCVALERLLKKSSRYVFSNGYAVKYAHII